MKKRASDFNNLTIINFITKLKFVSIFISFSFIGISGFAQSYCVQHGGTPPEPGVVQTCQDGGPCGNCPSCQAMRDERQKKVSEQQAQEAQTFAIQQAKQLQAQAEASRQAQKDLEFLKQADENKAQLEQLVAQNEAKRLAASLEFEKQIEGSRKERDDYMANLSETQQSFAGKAKTIDDDIFWDATVEMTNYETVYDKDKYLYAFKNKAGSLVTGYNYKYAQPYYQGVAPVLKVGDKSWSLINSKEEVLIRFDDAYQKKYGLEYFSIDPFYNGVAVIHTASYNFGCIDTRGKPLIKTEFSQIGNFQNEVAIAEKQIRHEVFKSEWRDFNNIYFNYYLVGIIDKNGEWVNPPKTKFNIEYPMPMIVLTTELQQPANLTYAEWKAQLAAQKILDEIEYEKESKRFDNEKTRRLNEARSQGMIIE